MIDEFPGIMISNMSEETKSENTSIGYSDGNMSEQNLTVSTNVVLGFQNTQIQYDERLKKAAY